MIGKMKKLFVWDFHGTLEKGNEFAAIEMSNLALAQLGFHQRFGTHHATELYGRNGMNTLKRCCPMSHTRHMCCSNKPALNGRSRR